MKPLGHDARIFLLTLAAGLPAVVIALAWAWGGAQPVKVVATVTVGVVGVWLGVGLAVRQRVARPLETLANLLAALREGDFSIRGRGARKHDALGLVMLEANALGDVLRQQRLGAIEATALLERVMAELDVAIFAFDEAGALRLVNPAGERLLGEPAARLQGRAADSLGLRDCLGGEAPRTLQLGPLGGPFELRRTSFRLQGRPHQLVVLPDLRRALREEERAAWQRLVRVLGHEINNSLAPIQSIAANLGELMQRQPAPADRDQDLAQGLAIIARRAEALGRFMTAYARLARLPPPQRAPVEIGALCQRVAALDERLPVTVTLGPAVTLPADADQIEQLLINLVRNAVDAALETGGGVRLGWTRRAADVEVTVEDDGPGLGQTANLFVPFFTTKPTGSGIGLVLSRQIAENHDGTLTLEERVGARGCVARLRLPI